MRVLIVSRGVVGIGRNSGGAELAAFELARHVALQGVDVLLVADVEQSVLDNVPPTLTVHPLTVGRAFARLALLIPLTFPRWLAQHLVGNIRAGREAVAVLKASGTVIDAVHAHGALGTILIGRALRHHQIPVPLIYTEHDSTPWTCAPRGFAERIIRRMVYRAVNLRACRYATVVATLYGALAMELSELTGLAHNHFVVAPNGTDAERFSPAGPVIAETAGAIVKRRCLFVGSLIPRKAPDILLRALALADSDLGLVIVGDGPMRGELRRLVKRLGLTGRVTFAGAQPQSSLSRYYQEAAFVVLPSVSEGAPLVLIEALSSGKPVIATSLKGIASIVHHGENGLLVPPGDVRALADALDELAGNDNLYGRLASRSAISVRDRFSWHHISRQIHVIYVQTSSARGADDPAAMLPIQTRKAARLMPFAAGRLSVKSETGYRKLGWGIATAAREPEIVAAGPGVALPGPGVTLPEEENLHA